MTIPSMAGSTSVVSPQVHAEFKTNLEQTPNNKVEQETHLELGGKMQSVKLTETSPQAEATGKGKKSLFSSIRNFFSQISDALGNLFSKKSNKAAAAQNKVLDCHSEATRRETKLTAMPSAAESKVKGESADKALAESLQNQFGLEAEQYLGEQPHATYSDAEVMALGLYTNGEYQDLNRALRQGKPLNADHTMIDQGMSAAFEKSAHSEQVVKTFRGTRGGDAFNGVTEGKVGHDAAYLSTSRDPQVAKNFGGAGAISTVFGRSGIDVSDISIEGDEQEILYNKETDMRVLLSAKDEKGVTRRVLEEATLGAQSGHHKGLLNALDLARETESTGKPAEQDIRLKMRGLDLA